MPEFVQQVGVEVVRFRRGWRIHAPRHLCVDFEVELDECAIGSADRAGLGEDAVHTTNAIDPGDGVNAIGVAFVFARGRTSGGDAIEEVAEVRGDSGPGVYRGLERRNDGNDVTAAGVDRVVF